MASKNTGPLSMSLSAASGYGHCGAAVRNHFFPLLAESASMRLRSWFANGTALAIVDSKSKSKPSTAVEPNGRLTEEPATSGPKMAQILFAALIAEV
jgi:hypothetical protein